MRRSRSRKSAASRSRTTRRTTRSASSSRRGAKIWSSSEVSRLRTAYRTKSATQIAREMRRTVSSVKSKARALGLRKPGGRPAAGAGRARRRR